MNYWTRPLSREEEMKLAIDKQVKLSTYVKHKRLAAGFHVLMRKVPHNPNVFQVVLYRWGKRVTVMATGDRDIPYTQRRHDADTAAELFDEAERMAAVRLAAEVLG